MIPSTNVDWCTYETVILYKVEQKQYIEALEYINKMGKLEDPRLIFANAQCYIGTNKYTEALELLLETERKGWNLPEVLKLKGKALYFLQEYETARYAFEEAELYSPDLDNKLWIQRCEVRIALAQEEKSRRLIQYEPNSPIPVPFSFDGIDRSIISDLEISTV